MCWTILMHTLIVVSQNPHTIKGSVTDEYGHPLIGAVVFTHENEYTSTEANGTFTLKIESGSSVLTIRYLGYEDKIVNISKEVYETNIGQIIMTERSTLLKEVSISSTVLPYKTTHKGTNYYVSPLQIKKMQPISTEEVLKTLPGVNVLGDMGLGNRINVSIRGSWGRRSEKVLMMEDGSPISPAPYVAPGIYYNPISDRVDGVEVLTGSDLLRYGPNNMFGIINYITPKPPQETRLRLKLSGGQRGYFTGLLSYGGTWKNVGSQVEAVYKRFDGFTQNSSVDMINLNAKIFAELSDEQSLYFKISGQFEDNQASWSSITPATFHIDPTRHPFDADRFTMHRYGLDIIYKWVPKDLDFNLITKIFASDFARDWWRQNSAVLRAGDVRNYVGEEIFSQKYKYLEGKSWGDNDFIRIGAIRNGRESTTNSAWHFTVASIEETFMKNWETNRFKINTEGQIKLHTETYQDLFLVADSSRWARSGRITRDQGYVVNSVSGYLRTQVIYKSIEVTPIIRLENVWMTQNNRFVNAQNPDLTSDREALRTHQYSIAQPGLSVAYKPHRIDFFGSVYRGYIAPSKYFAFLVERNGVLVNPLSPEDLSNVKPELSINTEIGMRGDFLKDIFTGQLAFFNNRISNFYLAGWNEFFEELAIINIRGIEAAMRFDILPKNNTHHLSLSANFTLLRSEVLSGMLVDRHLFTLIKHTDATRQEFVNKVNHLPSGYTVYKKNSEGEDVRIQLPIEVKDVDQISRTEYHFGKEGITNGQSPYSPNITYNFTANYSYKKLNTSFTFNYVGEQYAEFSNFENTSGDGGIGKLEAFQTFDINLTYDYKLSDNIKSTFFLSGKNLGDNIFVASRLNRGQSGIMPGGFRQINFGITIDFY